MMPWPKALGMSISCLGLWSTCSDWSLAQPISPPVHPSGSLVNGANIEQIVLPPAEDVPEEILRTEIIFEARSPLDGTPLSPADYAELQAELAAPQTTVTLNSDIRFIVLLLQARRAFKPVNPYLP